MALNGQEVLPITRQSSLNVLHQQEEGSGSRSSIPVPLLNQSVFVPASPEPRTESLVAPARISKSFAIPRTSSQTASSDTAPTSSGSPRLQGSAAKGQRRSRKHQPELLRALSDAARVSRPHNELELVGDYNVADLEDVPLTAMDPASQTSKSQPTLDRDNEEEQFTIGEESGEAAEEEERQIKEKSNRANGSALQHSVDEAAALSLESDTTSQALHPHIRSIHTTNDTMEFERGGLRISFGRRNDATGEYGGCDDDVDLEAQGLHGQFSLEKSTFEPIDKREKLWMWISVLATATLTVVSLFMSFA